MSCSCASKLLRTEVLQNVACIHTYTVIALYNNPTELSAAFNTLPKKQDGKSWICPAQEREKWRSVVHKLTNHRVLYNAVKFLVSF